MRLTRHIFTGNIVVTAVISDSERHAAAIEVFTGRGSYTTVLANDMGNVPAFASLNSITRTTPNLINVDIRSDTSPETRTLFSRGTVGKCTRYKVTVILSGNLVFELDATSPGSEGEVLHTGLPRTAGEDTRIRTLLDFEPVDKGALLALLGVGGRAEGAGLLVGEVDRGGDSGGGGGEVGGSGDGGDGCSGEGEAHLVCLLVLEGGDGIYQKRGGVSACECEQADSRYAHDVNGRPKAAMGSAARGIGSAQSIICGLCSEESMPLDSVHSTLH